MKIPNKIKIKGIEFDIIIEDLGDKIFGDYEALSQKIRLNSKASKEHRELTLIHEIIHALDIELKEAVVEILAQDLWLVLKENKLLKD